MWHAPLLLSRERLSIASLHARIHSQSFGRRYNAQLQRSRPISNSIDNPVPATTQLTVAEEKQLLKEAENSIEQLLALAETHPLNVHFTLGAARLLAKAGKCDQARALYASAEAAAATPADRSFVLVGWATFEMHHGGEEKAETLLEESLAIAPDMPAPLNALAKLKEKKGKYGAAEQLYRKTLVLQPSNFVSSQSLAVLLSRRGDHRAASNLFKLTSEAVPTHAPTWQAWALH